MPLTWNTVLPEQFPLKFENKDNILHTEGVFKVSYELWYCVDISVYHIQTEHGNLV